MTDDDPSAGSMSAASFRSQFERRLAAAGGLDPASTERALLFFNLSRAISRLGQDFENLHRRNGLSWTGFRILNVIWVTEDIEVRDIARVLGASRASTWSALNTLERNGLIVRARDTRDRRMMRARLTDGGLGILLDAVRIHANREAQWFEVLTPSQRSSLSTLLEQVADQPKPTDSTE